MWTPAPKCPLSAVSGLRFVSSVAVYNSLLVAYALATMPAVAREVERRRLRQLERGGHIWVYLRRAARSALLIFLIIDPRPWSGDLWPKQI